ncbi:hypothetical protein KCU91_g7651, partial [Aureobasidium melanogenum]
MEASQHIPPRKRGKPAYKQSSPVKVKKSPDSSDDELFVRPKRIKVKDLPPGTQDQARPLSLLSSLLLTSYSPSASIAMTIKKPTAQDECVSGLDPCSGSSTIDGHQLSSINNDDIQESVQRPVSTSVSGIHVKEEPTPPDECASGLDPCSGPSEIDGVLSAIFPLGTCIVSHDSEDIDMVPLLKHFASVGHSSISPPSNETTDHHGFAKTHDDTSHTFANAVDLLLPLSKKGKRFSAENMTSYHGPLDANVAHILDFAPEKGVTNLRFGSSLDTNDLNSSYANETFGKHESQFFSYLVPIRCSPKDKHDNMPYMNKFGAQVVGKCHELLDVLLSKISSPVILLYGTNVVDAFKNCNIDAFVHVELPFPTSLKESDKKEPFTIYVKLHSGQQDPCISQVCIPMRSQFALQWSSIEVRQYYDLLGKMGACLAKLPSYLPIVDRKKTKTTWGMIPATTTQAQLLALAAQYGRAEVLYRCFLTEQSSGEKFTDNFFPVSWVDDKANVVGPYPGELPVNWMAEAQPDFDPHAIETTSLAHLMLLYLLRRIPIPTNEPKQADLSPEQPYRPRLKDYYETLGLELPNRRPTGPRVKKAAPEPPPQTEEEIAKARLKQFSTQKSADLQEAKRYRMGVLGFGRTSTDYPVGFIRGVRLDLGHAPTEDGGKLSWMWTTVVLPMLVADRTKNEADIIKSMVRFIEQRVQECSNAKKKRSTAWTSAYTEALEVIYKASRAKGEKILAELEGK